MSKPIFATVLVLLLSLTSVVSAGASTPVKGGCPDGFALHAAHDHDEHHGHKHVGTDTDHNGDGLICAKHVSAGGDVHVHVDNNAALP